MDTESVKLFEARIIYCDNISAGYLTKDHAFH